jgi:glycosyltransferase involved in cell wall biosynthesis
MRDSPIDEARTAFEAGRYEDALSLLEREHQSGRLTPTSMRLAHDTFMKMGELHRAQGELNRLRQISPSQGLDSLARRLLGRIIETDPSWLPQIEEVTNLAEARQEPETDSPRRILHLLKESIPYSETGFTMRSRMTLSAQRLAGFSPEVVTSLGFPRSKGVEDFPLQEELDGVTHHRLDLGPENDVARLPFDISIEVNTQMAAGIARAVGPGLVQAGTGYRGYETALIGMTLAREHNVPFVYEVRGFQEQTWTGNLDRSERGEYYRRRFRQENRCMQAADRVITIAEAMAAEIADRGIPPEKLAVVPNAVDVERFTPRDKRPDLIEDYRLGDRFVVGYISNLGAREGIDQLIRAVGILRSRSQDVVCLVAGDGPERKRLDRLVSELDLEEQVILVGHVRNDQIEDHYALIDLFVVPRIDDRAARLVTPLKPLEAMSMGLPVIASSLPALEELVAPGDRGMTFPPSDPVAIAEVIDSLLHDDATRSRYAEAGRAWVRTERTLQSNARRYQEILGPLF